MILLAGVLLAACGKSGSEGTSLPTEVADTETPVLSAPEQPAVAPALPKIISIQMDRPELPRYETLSFELGVEADYANPYDARQVRLDGVFIGPDGKEMKVPGFWDGETTWRMVFTPSLEGEWRYSLMIQDEHGASEPAAGKFLVTPSLLHGWLQVGQWVDPSYSPRYLVYQDGTSFYGLGHCDALNILADGFSMDRGVGLFDKMKEAGENYVVWWPLYASSPISSSYDRYSVAKMKTIDLVVKDAEKKGIFLVFTIWDHPQLRAKGHPWGNGNWETTNGFHNLGSIESFFTDEEAWAWQENFYRYIIARWGYSTAIGMWQTVTEINGTNAFDQTDPWHKKVNDYFVANDPYRHPTTASMSGDTDWPGGFPVMDVPQVHVYALEDDAVKAAKTLAYWTELMGKREAKPNWVGEFGVNSNLYYPEMFHNAIWAALGAGAALTPAEWNDRGGWGQMTPEMNADLQHLGKFVADLPLAKWNPSPLQISSSNPQVRGWGVAGVDGGLLWVQDFALEGQPIETIRQANVVRSQVEIALDGLATGTYMVTPYNTWEGQYLKIMEVSCAKDRTCKIVLPDFKSDIAFSIVRK